MSHPRFVNIQAVIKRKSYNFSIPTVQLTSWEFQGSFPKAGQHFSISINAMVPKSITILSVTPDQSYQLLQQAGYCGLDQVVHNYSTGRFQYPPLPITG
jgi:hypothetical protein